MHHAPCQEIDCEYITATRVRVGRQRQRLYRHNGFLVPVPGTGSTGGLMRASWPVPLPYSK
eukprot:scaffold324454_cov53-Tisochrysis_lutea.AAC.1